VESYNILNEEKILFEKICNSLVELKDTSEIMMDLAYSSLLLNSKELAEEVIMLEDKVDNLHNEFELLVLSYKGVLGEAKGLLGLIRMGVVTERIADAAAEIAEVVLRGVGSHPVLKMVIEDADETVERVVVSENSPIVGKTLIEAKVAEKTGMWVLVVIRGNKWMRPKPWITINAGDVIIASGYSEGEADLISFVGGEKDKMLTKIKSEDYSM
jgi:uncharacterized protein with PhoU and TrkA domain